MTWLAPTLPVTVTQALLSAMRLPLIEKWNDPATALQTVMVGLTFLGLTDAFALPATKKVLPRPVRAPLTAIERNVSALSYAQYSPRIIVSPPLAPSTAGFRHGAVPPRAG